MYYRYFISFTFFGIRLISFLVMEEIFWSSDSSVYTMIDWWIILFLRGELGANKQNSEYTIDDVFRNDVQFTMMSEDAGMP